VLGPSRSGSARLGPALLIALAPAALGLSRFGYGVLLPAMRSELHWTYAQAGGLNTVYALGYVAGAVAAAPTIARLGGRRAFVCSLVLIDASMVMSGLTGAYPALLGLRVAAGIAGAVLYIAGGALAARLATMSCAPGLVLGIFFAGVGPGLLVSAVLAPSVLGSPDGWRMGWIVMGIVAAACAAAATWGAWRVPAPVAQRGERARLGRLRWAISAFGLYGLGYVSYMTFIVAYYRDAGRTPAQIMLFWSVLAVATAASGWIWRARVQRAGGAELARLLVVVAAGAALPLLSGALAVMLASAVLFGGAFLAVVAALTQTIRQTLPAGQWVPGLAVALALFGVGQVIGPVATGFLADHAGGLTAGLAASSGLLALAAVAASRQASTRLPDAGE
jgi:predicted MFS family arabinose efflux permease